ncbi:catenin (cadherin-associated protein) alpha, partial [Clonorchis sinensis]
VPQLELELSTALADVLDTASLFRVAVEAFIAIPTDSTKDIEVQRSAAAMLSSLSRLLILLGIADAALISDLVQEVRTCVQKVASATSPKTIATESDAFSIRTNQLLNLLSKRSAEAVNPDFQEQYNKARCILKTNGRLLSTSARVCLEHPDHIGAQNAKEYATKSLLDALNLIDSMLEDNQRPAAIRMKVSGKLLDDIEEFENNALVDTSQADNKRLRANLEQHINQLLPSVYRLADAQQTQSADKKSVYTQCNRLQQAVGDLVTQYNREPGNRPAVNSHMEGLLSITSGLKQFLGRIAVDHATQTLLNKDQPLMVLRDATKFGNEQRMDSAAQSFQEHSAAMVAAAYEVCALTTNEEVSKSTQLACTQLEQLCPQVVGSAYLLFRYPHSRLVEANFDAFCEAYENTANLLSASVNEMTSVHDVLAVTDDRIRTDFRKATEALSQRSETKVHRASISMERRCMYICEVVMHELENHRNNREYVRKVTERVSVLRDDYTQTFSEVSRDTLSHMAARQTPDEARFREAANNLCTAVHDVRLTVLSETGHSADIEALLPQRSTSSVTDEELGAVPPPADGTPPTGSKPSEISSSDRRRNSSFGVTSHTSIFPNAWYLIKQMNPFTGSLTSRRQSGSDSVDQTGETTVAQENQLSERAELFAMMTGPEKETMAQEFAGFLEEKKRFMREVVKWDDSANEIVALAKKMCVIIMDMTDFTRGKGPLSSTMDVIESARKVSDLGKRLDQLCRQIADMCPNSASHRDLLAYLQRITLHCHQLNITSRVKAGVQAGRAEVVENSTALVQAARNLMTAVILTIKQSYLASTKYLGPDKKPIIHWRMRAPPKKQLVSSPTPFVFESIWSRLNKRYDAWSEISYIKLIYIRSKEGTPRHVQNAEVNFAVRTKSNYHKARK